MSAHAYTIADVCGLQGMVTVAVCHLKLTAYIDLSGKAYSGDGFSPIVVSGRKGRGGMSLPSDALEIIAEAGSWAQQTRKVRCSANQKHGEGGWCHNRVRPDR